MTASSKVFLKRGFEADVEYMAAATRENEIERLALLNQLRKMVGGHRFATQLEIMQATINYILFLQEQLHENLEMKG
ncbi:hypothetical protein L596_010970 [Steinernema carpocapsae]|uniref:BHLH domain-containing protein n=1 Tax=Steinernema carpocapsae TaxID=34508 RepID=A0A4U5NT80_STECR|nr:hypothetical protein L596_010970 [Steinernema carpocapsae]